MDHPTPDPDAVVMVRHHRGTIHRLCAHRECATDWILLCPREIVGSHPLGQITSKQ